LNRKYLIEYRVDGRQPQRVELKRDRGWGYWPRMIDPDDGSEVPLLLDRRSGKVRFDVKNPALNFKAQRKAFEAEDKSQYAKALRTQPGTPVPDSYGGSDLEPAPYLRRSRDAPPPAI
jgi:hypothetical protein